MTEDVTIKPRLLKGFRDILPGAMLARNQMLSTIAEVLQTYGFLPLETPVLEYADILLGKLGDEGEKLLYRFEDHGGRDVAMRYDLTVPLARVMAQYPDLPKPLKRYQVGPVWRADNTQRGRYREFYQFDMDIVGTDAEIADAEIIVLIQHILQQLGLRNFIIGINDRQWLDQHIRSMGLNGQQRKAFYLGLDKLAKIGQDQVLAMWDQAGFRQSGQQFLAQIDQFEPSDTIKSVLDYAAQLGLKPEHWKIDATVVRGLDYYSGLVYETTLPDASEYGSVFSGGRYDGLVSRFSRQELPAVGASVGVDRLFAALLELGLISQEPTTTHAYITIFNPQLASHSLQVAKELRDNRIAVDLSFEAGNIGKQLKYAAQCGIPYAVIIGPDEAAADQTTLRDLQSGQEQKLSRSELLNVLSA